MIRKGILAFILAACCGLLALATVVDLVVLHTNDIHGRIEVNEGILGMPYISSLVSYHRSQYEHVLVLDAGDTFHGMPIATVLEGRSAVIAMNRAGYDVMVPGNHDFNFGYTRLLELEAEYMEFALVAANVFKEGEHLFNPYTIRELGDYRIGIFGLCTPSISTHPRNIRGIVFGDVVEASRRSVAILRDDHAVDFVIALGHIGINLSRRVAAEVPGIDLFVDGHSHTRLPQGERVGQTLIVQAHEYGNYLGKVTIDLSSGRPVMEATLISAQAAREMVEMDEEINALMQEFRDEIVRRLGG